MGRTRSGGLQFEGYSLARLCTFVQNDTSLGSPVQRLAALYSPEKSCFHYDYRADVARLRKTDWASQTGARQWTWQTCTEFGYYQTTDSHNQPFGSHVSLDFIEQVYCNQVGTFLEWMFWLFCGRALAISEGAIRFPPPEPPAPGVELGGGGWLGTYQPPCTANKLRVDSLLW